MMIRMVYHWLTIVLDCPERKYTVQYANIINGWQDYDGDIKESTKDDLIAMIKNLAKEDLI